MYLTKVVMDRNSPAVRRALTDCQKMHSLVMDLFDTNRQAAQALYRTNEVGRDLNIYIYSQIPAVKIPRCDFCQKDITSWLSGMEADQLWQFDLVASPSKKVCGTQKNSQRRILRSPTDRMKWMERKAEQCGFKILHISEQEAIHRIGRHKREDGGVMNLTGYRYVGVLQIIDADAFRAALQAGIGPGKAYGFGLMLLKRTY